MQVRIAQKLFLRDLSNPFRALERAGDRIKLSLRRDVPVPKAPTLLRELERDSDSNFRLTTRSSARVVGQRITCIVGGVYNVEEQIRF
jgi:hypothetical protein